MDDSDKRDRQLEVAKWASKHRLSIIWYYNHTGARNNGFCTTRRYSIGETIAIAFDVWFALIEWTVGRYPAIIHTIKVARAWRLTSRLEEPNTCRLQYHLLCSTIRQRKDKQVSGDTKNGSFTVKRLDHLFVELSSSSSQFLFRPLQQVSRNEIRRKNPRSLKCRNRFCWREGRPSPQRQNSKINKKVCSS